MFELFDKALTYGNKTAVIDPDRSHSYHNLSTKSDQLAAHLLKGESDLKERRVAFMVSPGFDHVTTQWAIWKAGGIAVPLCTSHPEESLRHTLVDSKSHLVIVHQKYRSALQSIAAQERVELWDFEIPIAQTAIPIPTLSLNRKAMILYTSGTTSKPKGVVITFGNIQAQVESLISAWEWHSNDHILNVLPLHHVHGIININTCALWSGAVVEFLPKFNEKEVFDLFQKGRVNLFMAVPTIYYKLISYFEKLPSTEQREISACLEKFRLMVSGSAALPIPTLEKWRSISNHTLLERYGMTEIGMGLSNPYRGERRPGHVGQPLPGVQIRLMKEDGEIATAHEESGEIQIKGDTVFAEYWQNAEASTQAFDDGWFKSGDIATIDNGSYKILGRNSVDIIKSGGYKISALEIEEVLLSHDDILECAVVGIEDDEWGEIIAAALVTKKPLDLDGLTFWMKSKLPGYKTPRVIKELDELPRNTLGKVLKNKLKAELK